MVGLRILIVKFLRNMYEYRCLVINEDIFNATKPILKYSLNNDKTVFSSLGMTN